MHRIHVRDLRGTDYGRNIQIAERQLRRPDADRFVGKAHRQRITVGLTVNHHRADVQFLARADDAQCNLAAVGYQDFLEHEKRGNNRPTRRGRANAVLQPDSGSLQRATKARPSAPGKVQPLTYSAESRTDPGRIRWAARCWRAFLRSLPLRLTRSHSGVS